MEQRISPKKCKSVLINVYHMHATNVAKHPRSVTCACSAYKSEYLYKGHLLLKVSLKKYIRKDRT